ncbi:MAG: T9SS type A sorting domain-containing protein [Ignavibacteria bacterium]|nr:T9SS type A sorting domain-containing protein [Ignavibacteria bacterium]
MLKKLLLATLLIVFGISAVNAQVTKAQLDKFSRIECKVKMVGDALTDYRVDGNSNNYGLPSVRDIIKSIHHKRLVPTWPMTPTFVPIGIATAYDLCSNGSPVHIWQDPATPDNIHIAVIYAPVGDGTTFPNRRTKYFYSSDRGTTWSYLADVPTGTKSGFPTISGFGDGTALIGNHTVHGGLSNPIAQAWKDEFAGTGSFLQLTPPLVNAPSSTYEPEWPRLVPTANTTLTNKFIMIGSHPTTSTTTQYDSTFFIRNTSLTAPGTWSAWQYFPADNAEAYAIERGADGRIGIAYVNNEYTQPSTYASMWFIESTDNGATFSTPLKIFSANFSGDSLGAFRGVSIVYKGNSPKVVFETLKQTTEGNYYPGMPANIRFWSPTLPGSDPNKSIVIADTTMIGWHPNAGTYDNLSSMGRPNIGVSADGHALFCTFIAPSDSLGGTTSTPFFNFYLTISGDGGNTWLAPQIVNPASPIKDWRYASVSKWNDNTASTYYVNINVLGGLVPGSYVNGAGESPEPYYFVRVAIPASVISVNQISTEVPSNYSLSQNYPNPFNPTTNIKFAVSKAGFVSLKVYNLAGKEVSTLVNQNLSVGTFEYSFNASSLASGIYFYTLNVNGFSETKKMMLIK